MANINSVASAPETANAPEVGAGAQGTPPEEPRRRPKFGNHGAFPAEVRRRVEEFFRATGRRQRDCPQMYLKTAIILATLASCYALLMFVVTAWWLTLLVAVPLGFAIAAVGFNIQHDGAHHAYSRYGWVNKLMSMTLDLVGASSYFWHWKHDVFHHTYANITGEDTDIDLGAFARMSPHQKRLGIHRWQHLYMWLLYGFMTIRWQVYGDFHDWLTGKVGEHKVPRPRGWDLVVFLGGKGVFVLGMALLLLVHPVWVVLLFYGTASVVVGIAMSIVFQLAHSVAEADFPLPGPNTGRMEKPWAVHQVETTVNYSRKSRLAAWLLGGLNFQIEHHLFPRICHVNYPAISKLVEETCREFGIRYAEHSSVGAGLRSHFRWLRRLGTAG